MKDKYEGFDSPYELGEHYYERGIVNPPSYLTSEEKVEWLEGWYNTQLAEYPEDENED